MEQKTQLNRWADDGFHDDVIIDAGGFARQMIREKLANELSNRPLKTIIQGDSNDTHNR